MRVKKERKKENFQTTVSSDNHSHLTNIKNMPYKNLSILHILYS